MALGLDQALNCLPHQLGLGPTLTTGQAAERLLQCLRQIDGRLHHKRMVPGMAPAQIRTGSSLEPTQRPEGQRPLLPHPDEKSKLRLARTVHWLYGTAWGGLRGLLPAFGLSPRAAAAAHFATVTGTAMVTPPALGVAPPPQEQPPAALGTATVHHVVYALATAAAFSALDRRRAA